MNRLDAAVVFARLERLSLGMRFDDLGFEGDQAVNAFCSDGVVVGPLDRASFSTTVGIPEHEVRRFERGGQSLHRFVQVMSLPVFGPDAGRRAEQIVELMMGNLRDISVVVGTGDGEQTCEFPTWIVGAADDGRLVGLKSAVVWT